MDGMIVTDDDLNDRFRPFRRVVNPDSRIDSIQSAFVQLAKLIAEKVPPSVDRFDAFRHLDEALLRCVAAHCRWHLDQSPTEPPVA